MYMNVSFNIHDLQSLNTSFSVMKSFFKIIKLSLEMVMNYNKNHNFLPVFSSCCSITLPSVFKPIPNYKYD